MTENYLTAEEAADFVGVSSGLIRKELGVEDKKIQLRTGHRTKVWHRDRVEAFKLERELSGKKPRKRIEKRIVPLPPEYTPKGKGNQYKFEVDAHGRKIPPKSTYRGRTCRFEGCPNPAATGQLYCDDHSEEMIRLRKNAATYAEMEYSCHV